MVAQRQAMLHRIRLVEILVHTALCIAAPKAWACQAPEHSPCEINKCYMYFGISARAQKQKFSYLGISHRDYGLLSFSYFPPEVGSGDFLIGGFSYS